MSVDGIGSGGRPPKVGGATPTQLDEKVEGPTGFNLEKAQAAPEAEASTALDQLHRGEIDLERYLDVRVQHAVRHLADKVPTEQLDFIRDSLKAQMRTDPVLVELLQRATGAVSFESDR